MYNNRSVDRRGRGQNRGFFCGNGNSRGGGYRTIKSFDPTGLINSPQERSTNNEHVITHSFNDFRVSDSIKRNITDKGYKIPTPIQDQAIDPIIEGRDLIGIANTGTGKTAAFLIPLINKVLTNRNQKVLIVTPTRELAAQIRDEFSSFSRGLQIYSALCIGGASMGRQINDLRRNPNFVIGTPGRLEDLIRSRNLNLFGFGSVVLDEADHMVDIGFIQNVRFIISCLSTPRQSLFFSATIDGKVREVLQSFVKNPVTVSVKTGETAENITQNVIRVNGSERKIEHLHKLLITEDFEKVLIFGRTKHGVQKLSDNLVKRGFRADAIHGNKRQSQRIRTLENFKRNNIQILIATDVASRGLDIPNVSHVINYDLPESHDAYIHRIGRTGRADKKGIALTFIG
ncbi:MAG: DEAD/DEAH RNA helicase [Candidatus Woesebacteria bacterium GW2011_GWB1_41_10]|uniref:DEAD/DEAH RNA helicase n=1 Tax=Candidatus Woesebacteria bacterium GW2011_GWB1_41_10 TaxID=1618577 RepID=A0A0G0UCU2_9BACT|nr:MAG: DEAD/DEAH RNA helicase [Candidatus Woesebacteria bacterium GW2011_GWB1_41_10]